MRKNITAYIAISYSLSIINMLNEKFGEDYPYIKSENVAIILPQKFVDRKSIPSGLLFNTGD